MMMMMMMMMINESMVALWLLRLDDDILDDAWL